MSDTIPVLLIDHHKLFRFGLINLLKGSQFQIVAEAATVAEALTSGCPLPAVILIDPVAGEPGAEAIATLREFAPSARIVVLTTQIDAASLPRLLEAGADGCLLKDTTPEALVEGIKLVMLG